MLSFVVMFSLILDPPKVGKIMKILAQNLQKAVILHILGSRIVFFLLGSGVTCVCRYSGVFASGTIIVAVGFRTIPIRM